MPPDAPPGGLAFAIRGIPVAIRPSFLILVLFLGTPMLQEDGGVLRLALWVLIVTVSILWHEVGHAWAMRRLGGTPRIELYGLGGLTHWEGVRNPSPGRRAFVSVAGPAAGFALGLVALGAWAAAGMETDGVSREVIAQILWVNVGWGALNLLPMLPLDGGHVMHALLDHVTRGRGAQPARLVSLGVAGVALALSLYAGWIWAAVLCALTAVGTYQDYVTHRARAQDALLERALLEATAALAAGRTDPARAVLTYAREQAARPELRAAATEQYAWALLLEGDPAGAERATRDFPAGLSPSPQILATLAAVRGRDGTSLLRELDVAAVTAHVLRALLANGAREAAREVVSDGRARDLTTGLCVAVSAGFFGEGRFEDAGVIAEAAFERFGDPTHAYNVACCLARLERGPEALAWLEKAFQRGYRDLEHLRGDDDLAAAKAQDGFEALLARFEKAG